MKELSEWQLVRVRNALRAYHCFERSYDGAYFTWIDVREAIAEYTDVEIGATPRLGGEILRKFVEGVPSRKNSGQITYPVPKPDVIEAIVAFITHEDIALLRSDELELHYPAVQAQLRLLEYLELNRPNLSLGGFKSETRSMNKVLSGRYRWNDHRDDCFIVSDLILGHIMKNRLIEVVQTYEVFKPSISIDELKRMSPTDRKKALLIRYDYSGWAILTPEYNLFFFLKEKVNGTNRYFFTLGTDFDTSLRQRITTLVLLDHEFPVELEKDSGQSVPEMMSEITSETLRQILPFIRLDMREVAKERGLKISRL